MRVQDISDYFIAKALRQMVVDVPEVLDVLPLRRRRILEARWLSEKDALTLQQLAEELDVSSERVRQLEADAFRRVRHAYEQLNKESKDE